MLFFALRGCLEMIFQLVRILNVIQFELRVLFIWEMHYLNLLPLKLLGKTMFTKRLLRLG